MNSDPISDTLRFLVQPGWTTGIFRLLLLGSIAIAIYVYRTIPGQRSIEHLANWAIRVVIGCMWWQQTLWKLPPTTPISRKSPSAPLGSPIGWG